MNNQEIVNYIKGMKFRFIHQRGGITFHPLGCPSLYKIFSDGIDKVIPGGNYDPLIIMYYKDKTIVFQPEDKYKKTGLIMFSMLQKDYNLINKSSKKLAKESKLFINYLKNISKIFSKSADKQLIEYYKKYVKEYYKVCLLGEPIPFAVNHELGRKIESILNSKIKDRKKVLDYYSFLTTPTELSFINKEEMMLNKIADKIKKNKKYCSLFNQSLQNIKIKLPNEKKLYKIIKKHESDFFWIPYDYVGTVWSINDFAERIKILIKKDRLLTKEEDYTKNIKKKQEKLFSELIKNRIITKEQKKLFIAAQDATLLLDLKKEKLSQAHYYINQLFKEIAKRKKADFWNVIFLLENELNDFLSGKIKESILKKRRICSTYVTTKGRICCLGPNETEEIYKHCMKKINLNLTEISGTCASPGNLIAKVRILRSPKEVNKVEKGEIIVAGMTTPEYVPAMKKAAAIITDEGGITCHAAIVSRELGIPCITGIKNATKLLKEGEFIEVDAGKGIVNKISKEDKMKQTKQIQGQSASPGRIAGKVKIVLNKKDIHKVKEEDILVTKMTSSDFRGIIKKISGIITDEGGVTSHASIVSREQSIPCIIGAGNATKLLKDGDYIDLDAAKGIAKIITKKDYEKIIKELEKEERIPKITSAAKEKLEIKPDLISWFKDTKKEDILLVGGKGANLGEMFSTFPIPNGFCITVNIYKRFMEENNFEEKIFSLLSKLDVEDTKKLDSASKKIEDWIINSKLSKDLEKEILLNYKKLGSSFVAVRSSATAEDLPTASFAGQQATLLNVKGEKDLIKAVKECWASLFTSRAIYYRVVNKFHHEKVLICVVVQQMVDSETAGVMFSVNPVNKDYNEIIIEGSYGLGESVVSGSVNPDGYVVDKKKMIIKEERINEKRMAIVKDAKGKNKEIKLDYKKANSKCLSDKEVIELAKTAVKIEKHYGKPQDMEWAINKGKIYILQSRPITTL